MDVNMLENLERLAKLKEQGAITDTEYEQQKAQILEAPKPTPVYVVNKTNWPRVIGVILALIIGAFLIKTAYDVAQVW